MKGKVTKKRRSSDSESTGTTLSQSHNKESIDGLPVETVDYFLDMLQKRYQIPYHDLISLLKEKERRIRFSQIPISIFTNRSLGMLESLVKYLKDHQHRSFNEISKVLKRDNRTIWASYHKATKKDGTISAPAKCDHFIPIETFSNRLLGPAENVTYQLHAHQQLPFCAIAGLLNRDQRTIWTMYHHASRKLGIDKTNKAEGASHNVSR